MYPAVALTSAVFQSVWLYIGATLSDVVMVSRPLHGAGSASFMSPSDISMLDCICSKQISFDGHYPHSTSLASKRRMLSRDRVLSCRVACSHNHTRHPKAAAIHIRVLYHIAYIESLHNR